MTKEWAYAAANKRRRMEASQLDLDIEREIVATLARDGLVKSWPLREKFGSKKAVERVIGHLRAVGSIVYESRVRGYVSTGVPAPPREVTVSEEREIAPASRTAYRGTEIAIALGCDVWRVRAVVGSSTVHLVSRIEPCLTFAADGTVESVSWDIVQDTEYGDTLLYLDPRALQSVSYRRYALPEPALPEPAPSSMSTADMEEAILAHARLRPEGWFSSGSDPVEPYRSLVQRGALEWDTAPDGTLVYRLAAAPAGASEET